MPDLALELVTSEAQLLSLRPDWEALHAAARGTVFQSFAWQSAWWRVYGNDFTLRTAAIRDGSRLVALLPCFTQRLGVPPLSLTRLRLLGEHEIYGEYRPLVDPGYLEPAAVAAARFLAGELRRPGCDLVDFNSLPSDTPFSRRVCSHLEQAGLAFHCDGRSLDRVILPLPPDDERYMAGLSKRARMHVRHDEKQLLQRGATPETVTDPARAGEALDKLESLHAAGWSRKGGENGYFSSRPRFGQFLRKVIPDLMARNAVRFHFLSVDGRPVGATMALVMNGHCSDYLGGFDPEHPLSKFSPGKIVTVQSIRDAIRLKCEDYDLQGGCEPYKLEVGGKLSSFSRIMILGGGTASAKGTVFMAGIRLQKLHRRLRYARRDRHASQSAPTPRKQPLQQPDSNPVPVQTER